MKAIIYFHKLRTTKDTSNQDGLQRSCSGRESVSQCRRHRNCGFNPWIENMPWRMKWYLTPVFFPGESHGQRSLADYSPWGHNESDTTECRRDLHSSNTKLGAGIVGIQDVYFDPLLLFKCSDGQFLLFSTLFPSSYGMFGADNCSKNHFLNRNFKIFQIFYIF